MSRIIIPNLGRRIIHNLLDLLFPRRCFGCGQTGVRLCSDCLNRLPRSLEPRTEKIISVFNYDSPIVKQAIWSLKYKKATDLAEVLAQPLYETLIEELSDDLNLSLEKQRIVLLPVPLSARRRRQRGYNQAEELAEQMAALNPGQFEVRTNIIKKIRNTPTQVSIKSRPQRLKNLEGAFALASNCSLPAEAIIIIIDDVATTGATIGEIRKLLSRSGIKRIYGLVVAHG